MNIKSFTSIKSLIILVFRWETLFFFFLLLDSVKYEPNVSIQSLN